MANSVKKTIQDLLAGKDKGLRGGVFAMRDILRTLQGQVLADLGEAALGTWNAHHLKKVAASLEKHVAAWEARARAELGVHMDGAWEYGAAFVENVFKAGGVVDVGGFALSESVLETLKDFAFMKMKGVGRSAFERIRAELTIGSLGQKTPQDIAAAIGTDLTEGSVFGSIARRSEVITGTELGRVFSTAAQLRMEQAAEHVPGLMKMWLHRGHPERPRPMHLLADGTKVPVNMKFNIGGVMMEHPRDPAAPLKEIINCGCDHVPWHPSWDA